MTKTRFTRMRHGALFASAAAIVATVPGAAHAQVDPTIEAGPEAREVEDDFGAIVVTAQRREELLQDVPVVITAFSNERLDQIGVTEPQDLYGSVPSLVIGTQGQGSREVQSYAIRGQGSTFQASPAVPVYLSEVPLISAISLSLQGGNGNFVDLENVQVLSGPQGTLFGRNTTGGAVLLVPAKPNNELGASVEVRAGNYDLRQVQGVVNVPIVDDELMVRVVGAMRKRDGYTRDLVWDKDRDDVDWFSGRIGIMMQPTDRFSNYILAYGSKSSTNGAGHIHGGFNIEGLKGVGFCFDDPANAVPGLGFSCEVYREQSRIAEEIGPRPTRLGQDQFDKLSVYGLSNTTRYNLSDTLTVQNIVSYQTLRSNYSYDGDATPLQQYDNQIDKYPDFPIEGLAEFGLPLFGYQNAVDVNSPRDDLEQVTNELQLQGSLLDNNLDFVLGGFYYNQTPAGPWRNASLNYCPALFTGLCGPNYQSSGVSNRSKALFAQATLDFGAFSPGLEGLALTGGYRYTWDRVKGFANSYSFNADGLTIACNNTSENLLIENLDDCEFSSTLKSSAPTWTVGLDWEATPDLLVYGKVSRGYKAGGFNAFSVRPTTRVFGPEELTSYEAGFKSSFNLGAIPSVLNISAYHSDYKNIQRAGGDFNPVTGASGAQILNPTARIRGIEGQFSIRPVPQVELGGTASYTDADYKEFNIPVLAPGEDCNGPVNFGDVGDVSCIPFQYVSPWIVNVYTAINVPMGVSDMKLFVSYSFVDDQNTDPLTLPKNQPGGILESYSTLDASLDLTNVADTGIDLGLFATNITNELYRVSNTNVFQIGSLLTRSGLYGEPRMYGVKLGFAFGGEPR